MDAYVFRAIQGSTQVKVGQVKAGETCIWGGQSAIEEELDGFQRATCVAGVAYVVALNGDPGVVLFYATLVPYTSGQQQTLGLGYSGTVDPYYF